MLLFPPTSRRKPGRAILAAALLVLAAFAQAPDRGEARPAQEAEARASCCFTHAQYSGVCVVEPGKDETCASILGYLNNPQSQGKSYCGSTSLRGGWQTAACPRK